MQLAAHRGWRRGAIDVLWREVVRKRAGALREELGAQGDAGQARTPVKRHVWERGHDFGARVRSGESIQSRTECP